MSDRRRQQGLAAVERSQPRTAVACFVAAADLARDAGDPRRFAEAALDAAGDGWRTSLDATNEAISLLAEAVARVPVGPTALRSRLMARLAVVRSHHLPTVEAEAAAARALAIARALGQPTLVTSALHALSVVVWDPLRRQEHWNWIDELLHLARAHPEEPWRRWALPVVARLRATDGDITGACLALDELDAEGTRCGDVGAPYAASQVAVLRATLAGDWPAARAAAAAVRAAGEAVVFDPGDSALMEKGMLGIIDLLAGPTTVGELAPLDWPLPSMELSVKAWHTNCLARAGRSDQAAAALAAIDPDTVLHVDHDGYWLPTLSMLSDGAHLTRCRPIAETVLQSLLPVAHLTIADPGLCYRGTAAHAAGIAAATCGRRRDAHELLSAGLASHLQHGSPWMTERSQQAIAMLATGVL